MKSWLPRIVALALIVIAFELGVLISRNAPPVTSELPLQAQQEGATATLTRTPTPTETFPPSTPLATLTPTKTLRPPPTFEPPTATPPPSNTPLPTATFSLPLAPTIEGIRGLETPTPTSTPGCELRDDWGLLYVVQPNDALANIAQRYNTSVEELAEANCIRDVNVIRAGQELRVPGSAHPSTIQCGGYEVLTPIDYAYDIDPNGQLTFNWRAERADRWMIRVHRPNGTVWERTIDRRQNETINVAVELPEAGTFTWYVLPLNMGFQQVCPSGGPWTFTKGAAAPTPTPLVVP
jgi:LysM repeat protein